jgi:hypothetical protein
LGGESIACRNHEGRAMAYRTFRDILGDPSTWIHSVTSSRHRPNMRDATIQDVFCTGPKLSLHTKSAQYGETMTVFHIPDAGLRWQIMGAIRRGMGVHTFLRTAV